MYLIQFGIYRMYDNARKALLVARQNGIDAVMRYDGIFFRVVSNFTFEDPKMAQFMCDLLRRQGRVFSLPFAFVRKADSF